MLLPLPPARHHIGHHNRPASASQCLVRCGISDTTPLVEAVGMFVLEYTPRSADDNFDTEDIGSEASSAKPDMGPLC